MRAGPSEGGRVCRSQWQTQNMLDMGESKEQKYCGLWSLRNVVWLRTIALLIGLNAAELRTWGSWILHEVWEGSSSLGGRRVRHTPRKPLCQQSETCWPIVGFILICCWRRGWTSLRADQVVACSKGLSPESRFTNFSTWSCK